MKSILIISILSFSLSANGQNPCGVLTTKPVIYSTWKSVDTLGQYSSEIGWVESTWTPCAPPQMTTLLYVPPVGCPVRPPIVEKQQRIGKKSGILQERTRTIEFYFVPNPKTEFETIIETVK